MYDQDVLGRSAEHVADLRECVKIAARHYEGPLY